MILDKFRKRLADEMCNFPEVPNTALQTHALITATLARKILEYLKVTDLKLPNGCDPEISYNLKRVLDRIIHFRELGQESLSVDSRKKPDLITLYSDQKPNPDDHMHIRLADYQDIMNRLATDNLFVAAHLLRRTVTLLSKALKAEDESKLNELRLNVFDLVADTLNILQDLSATGKVEIPSSPVNCYEYLQAGRIKEFARFPTFREFFDGYQEVWNWYPGSPKKFEIEGCETYCILVQVIEVKENSTIRLLMIPVEAFRCFFIALRKQIG